MSISSLNWFNTSVEGGVDTASFSGNFKILGDIEVTGLVRRNGEVFESITPQWNVVTNGPGKIYFSPIGITPNVGIGTSNPTKTLDVIGDISYTGDLVRNNQILNFGLGAWNGNLSGTIYYGGNVNNRVGVGSGFGPNITARGVIHAWGISQFNNQDSSPWDPTNGIRIGPHEINSPFLQMGVMNSPTKSWSWIQSATVTTMNPSDSSLFSTSDKPLLLNPDGGNIGVGVFSIDNVDASISITSRGGVNEFTGSKFRKSISLGPETHNSETVDYNHLIYSKYFAMGFRDNNAGIGSGDRGLFIMSSTNSTSWRTENWEGSVIMTYKIDGKVGIGTTDPRLRLSISSTVNNGISISNPNIDDDLGFGIQRSFDGLSFGTLPGSDTVVSDIMLIRSNGARGIKVSDTIESSFYRIGNNVVMSAGQLGSSIQTSSLTSVGTLSNLNVFGSTTLNGLLSVGGNVTTGGSLTTGSQIKCNNVIECDRGGIEGPALLLRNTLKTSTSQSRVWRIWNMTGSYGDSLQFWRYTGTSETPSGPTLTLTDSGDTRINGKLRLGSFYFEYNSTELFIKHDNFPSRYCARFINTGNTMFIFGPGQNYYSATSDIRLKENIRKISSSDTLVNVLKLNPIEFEYTDKKYGDKKLGFSAQEVNEIIPRAVTKSKGSLFTIDCIADVMDDRTMLFMRTKPKSQVKPGQNISILVGEINPYEMKVDVLNVNDDIITISQAVSSDFTEVHIYGHIHDDIHVIDYTVITTANTSAIQALSLKLTEANREIDILKSELNEIKRLISNRS